MKISKLPLFLVALSLIISTSTVLAQNDDPPPGQPEINAPLQGTYTALPTPDKIEINETISRTSTTRTITPVSSLMEIADESGVIERNSAIAHGGDIYAVAHEYDDEIDVVFIQALGDGSYALVRGTVSDNLSRSSNPAIAYLAGVNLFIVTWQYDFAGNGSNYDIHAVALDPWSLGYFVGSEVTVVSSAWHEMHPDIACNYYDQSCLITYGIDNSSGLKRIDGRIMDISSSGVSNSSPGEFPISDWSNVEKPYAAWSDIGYSYMIAYTWTDSVDDEKFPVYSVIHSIYQTVGDQLIQGMTYAVDGAWYLDGRDKIPTGIAYDFCAERFLIPYTYDFNGDASDLDIHASSVSMNGERIAGPFIIAQTDGQETSTDISFITDPIPSIANNAPSRFVAAYRRDDYSGDNGIMTAEIQGNCSSSTPSYTAGSVAEHFLVKAPPLSVNSRVEAPAISGASASDFMVTLTNVTAGTVWQFDILGRIFSSINNCYLPLILK